MLWETGTMINTRWLLIGLIAFAACGVEASPPLPVIPIEGTDRTIDVSMTEFVFSPPDLVVGRGETVGFRVTNEGAVGHEFRLTTDENVAEVMAARDLNDEAVSEVRPDELLNELAPGETREILVTFDDEVPYETLVCLIPGHFEAGMQASLTVNN